jgi:choline-sulfatase
VNDQTESASSVSRRRVLQSMGAAGVVAAGLAAGAGSAAASEPLAPFTPRGKLTRRPNFLVIIVDEQRMAPVYESEALKVWRRANLPTQNFLRNHAADFTNHHIMSAACAPSRASIFTGQYPSLHGVTQTSGAAKSAIEGDLYWLDPATVPTMGSWFRAGGYDTYYKGKWHVSDADLYQPGGYQPLPSYNNAGLPDKILEDVYLEADRLEGYGFEGWIGPEPHGSNPLNSGSSGPGGRGRDEAYATMGIKQLQQLQRSRKPWLLVNSFVNPHDITLWGDLSLALQNLYLAQQLVGSNVPSDLFGPAYTASSNESLDSKPQAQASYRDTYPLALQPTRNGELYHRFYYQLQKNVDEQIGRVINALTSSREQYRDTIVIYMSDHGELLGSHGGMYQKWHNAYDEVVKVPFVIHNPQLFPQAVTSDVLTSHADLIPTMLGLAGLDEAVLRTRLRASHTQVRELPGRDLSSFLLGEDRGLGIADAPQFFMTDDEPFKGVNQVSWQGSMYAPVIQPNHLETVFTTLPTGPAGAKEQWKYTRYWDNPAFWSSPNVKDIQTIISGSVNTAGTKTATTVIKYISPTAGQTGASPDQIEVYNVSADPTEMNNLATNSAYTATVALLKNLLDEQRALKRLTPTEQPWADGSQIQFPYTM